MMNRARSYLPKTRINDEKVSFNCITHVQDARKKQFFEKVTRGAAYCKGVASRSRVRDRGARANVTIDFTCGHTKAGAAYSSSFRNSLVAFFFFFLFMGRVTPVEYISQNCD